jgi:transcriptional regulator with XRE-family HTH domain
MRYPPLLTQIKQRRLALGLKQHDMRLRIGMSRQQFQRLETQGNPRLDTLSLLADGLGTQLVLVPNEKLRLILTALADDSALLTDSGQSDTTDKRPLDEDPWQGLLGDDE